MKVIKKGSENPNGGKKLTCTGSGVGKGKGGCGAVLLVKPCDVSESHYTDYGGGSDTSYSFACPECGATTYFSSNPFYKGHW